MLQVWRGRVPYSAPVQGRPALQVWQVHIGSPAHGHVVQEGCLPILGSHVAHCVAPAVLKPAQRNQQTCCRSHLPPPLATSCAAASRTTHGDRAGCPAALAQGEGAPEVGARPEQRLGCLERPPHGCPVQPCLPCGVDQVWLGPALQQKADDCHPVVQGPPLQGVVPLRVCLIHLQGSVAPIDCGTCMPNTQHS